MKEDAIPTVLVDKLPEASETKPTKLPVKTGGKTIHIPMEKVLEGMPNPTLDLMKAALTKVEEVLTKADQTVTMLQQNLTQVTNQKIGLSYQKAMLLDLIGVVEKTNKK